MPTSHDREPCDMFATWLACWGASRCVAFWKLAGLLGGEPLRGLLHLHGGLLLRLELSFSPGDSRAICRWLRVLGFRGISAANAAAISARCGLPDSVRSCKNRAWAAARIVGLGGCH
jgi:hypothetical protein